MVRIGYHASHEQFAPRALLQAVRFAEQAGFQAAMCSDHFAPWGERQGESGYTWSWLGAALQATDRMTFGTVTPPVGFRYHPAILAQAAATLESMFSGRLWLALGSGEALNEHVTGEPWPEKEERNARLAEGADIMRALFAGETVTRQGLIRVDRAKLYTRPARAPRLLAAALSPETAAWAASWAEGLITTNLPDGRTREVVEAFRDAGGRGKPVAVQVHLSWARSESEALRQAHAQWGTNALPSTILANVSMPQQFDSLAKFVRPEDVRESVVVSADPLRHVAYLEELAALGVDEIYLHQVGQDQRGFIEMAAKQLLPRFS